MYKSAFTPIKIDRQNNQKNTETQNFFFKNHNLGAIHLNFNPFNFSKDNLKFSTNNSPHLNNFSDKINIQKIEEKKNEQKNKNINCNFYEKEKNNLKNNEVLFKSINNDKKNNFLADKKCNNNLLFNSGKIKTNKDNENNNINLNSELKTKNIFTTKNILNVQIDSKSNKIINNKEKSKNNINILVNNDEINNSKNEITNNFLYEGKDEIFLQCEHPNCVHFYKTLIQKINHHKKLHPECKSDTINILYGLLQLKKIIQNINKRNKKKNKKLVDLYLNVLKNIPHREYARTIIGYLFY